MKIYSMTATFGKLEHQTLTLQPGMNIIEAPNEWGKSTWCAFLVNMLYGLETRARTTKAELADKERYAPWSASPMAGRIDLNWNGRDITIERRTKGRLVFGEFTAYETASGLEIPELTGANCGSLLLGVERSVFTRAGFLKLSDLPVSQDEALRRRLNSLVTTGDESGAGDKLQQALKDLKNKCRYNRSGLLPQAEAQRAQLTGQLHELADLQQQTEALHIRQKELEVRIRDLENHKTALHFAAAQEDTEKVEKALQAQKQAEQVCADLTQSCDGLPSSQEALEGIRRGEQLRQRQLSLQLENSMLPPLPTQPEGYTPGDSAQKLALAKEDFTAYTQLEDSKKKRSRAVLLLSALALVLLLGLALCTWVFSLPLGLAFPIAGAAIAIGLAGLFIMQAVRTRRHYQAVEALFDRHPGITPGLWITHAEAFDEKCRSYEQSYAHAQSLRGDLDARLSMLNREIAEFTQGESLAKTIDRWQQIRASRDALMDAARTLQLAQSHAAALQSMARTAQPPLYPDVLTYTEPETDGFLQSARFELRQLQLKLGQYQGRSEALGQEAVLRSQLKAVNQRISRLEDTYSALEIAQKALSSATQQLQRRFAPRISKRAQALFCQLTGGRYDRLTLSEDFSLNASAQTEDTLRSAQWRSDGTIDQLYFALRLAVAEELTPDAPIVLDDALARFDDIRAAAALDILQKTAQNKQVILFTCQGREKELYGRM